MKKILFNLGFGSLGLVIGLLGMQVFHINGKTVSNGSNPAPKLHIEDNCT